MCRLIRVGRWPRLRSVDDAASRTSPGWARRPCRADGGSRCRSWPPPPPRRRCHGQGPSTGQRDVAAHKAVSFTVLGVAGVPKTGVAAVVVKLTASSRRHRRADVYAAGPSARRRSRSRSPPGHDGTNTVVVVLARPARSPRTTARAARERGPDGRRLLPHTVRGSPTGSYFHPVTPRQLTSTLVKKAGSFSLATTGLAGVPAAAATVAVQLSVANPGTKGVLTVSPSGGTRSKATALAFAAGRSGTALVKATPGPRAGCSSSAPPRPRYGSRSTSSATSSPTSRSPPRPR